MNRSAIHSSKQPVRFIPFDSKKLFLLFLSRLVFVKSSSVVPEIDMLRFEEAGFRILGEDSLEHYFTHYFMHVFIVLFDCKYFPF